MAMSEKNKKKRAEEEEEMRLQETLQEFQTTFEHSNKYSVPKTFIRGAVVNAEKGSTVTVHTPPPSLYKPTPVVPKPPAVVAAATHKAPLTVEQSKRIAEEAARKIMEQARKTNAQVPLPPPANRPSKPGTKKVVEKPKMSNLEIFKEELKQVQAMRQERKGLRQQLQEKLGVDSETIDRIAPSLDNPYLDSGSMAYEDDPSTTNLYIANLPSDVKMEEDLYTTFGTFGPLASAKIIYPRADDSNERRRDFYSGFVAYMARKDAERALCAMDGEKIRGHVLRVTWARPVTIPQVPFFVPIALRELAMPDPPSGLPFNAKPLPGDLKAFLDSYHELPRLNVPLPENEDLKRDYNKMVYSSVVRVVIPTERPLLTIIHRVIEFIVREGPSFEAILMAREKANPVYRFLFENHHPTHVYYRWKLYSVLQGDDLVHWRLDRFKMFDGDGPWWEPPPHSLVENGMPAQLYETAYVPKRKKVASDQASHRKRRYHRSSSSSDEEERNGRRQRDRSRDARRKKGLLESAERDKLENIIRNLIPEKEAIADATAWCLEHAECAKEIVRCLLEALSIKETPLHKKIARFYLCSDILANCGVRIRDVSYFRQYFEEVLMRLFSALGATLASIQSRIKAEQFRSRVMLCFRMWEDNSIYPTEVLIHMQNVFLGLTQPDGGEEEVRKGTTTGEEEDLDGEPIGEDAMEEDLDGAPLVEEEAAIGKPPPEEVAAIHESRFTTSSWSQVDVETEQRQQVPSTKWEKFTGVSKWETHEPLTSTFSALSSSPDHGKRIKIETGTLSSAANEASTSQPSLQANSTESREREEERRKMLREIELKVMKLQDELEADGLPAKKIEEETVRYRKKLMDRMDGKPERSKHRSNGGSYEEERSHRERHEVRDRRHSRRSRSREREEVRSDRDHERRKERSPDRRWR